jgi:hypothetical protein
VAGRPGRDAGAAACARRRRSRGRRPRRARRAGHVIEAVRLVSRADGDSYEQFIERIAASGNQLAILVKLADLHDNTDPARELPGRPELRARYAAARRLTPELRGPPPDWLGAPR